MFKNKKLIKISYKVGTIGVMCYVIIKWGSPIYMSAAIEVTAVPSFDTQIFLCEIKLNYKQYIL